MKELIALGALLGPVVSSSAADPVYLGRWKVTTAVVAPWADAERRPDEKERARLLGKTVTVAGKAISGPAPFACKDAHYAFKDYTADMLFQGAFDELRSRDNAVDPDKLAASLGFKSKQIRTLETGCEIDFHFVDERTAEVGLNNAVYTLIKE